MKALRFCAGFLTVVMALYFSVGCENNDQAREPVNPPTAEKPSEPAGENLVETVYQGKLQRYSDSDSYILKFYSKEEEVFSFEKEIQNHELTLRDKLTGIWGTGIGTKDYPSSLIIHWFLELTGDNKAKYWTEKGHEEFIVNENRIDETKGVRYVKDSTTGPYWGTWKMIGDDGIELKLCRPKDSSVGLDKNDQEREPVSPPTSEKPSESEDLEKDAKSFTGIVRYFEGLAGIGGEGVPGGYILEGTFQEPVLIRQPYGPEYLYLNDLETGETLKKYLGKTVRVIGDIDYISVGGVETPLRHYPVIKIIKIEEIQ